MAKSSYKQSIKTSIDHRQFLLAQELFAGIAAESPALDHFISEITLTSFARGEQIYQQGGTSVEMYLVRDGEIHLRQMSEQGHSRLIGKQGRGSLFGEVSFMNSCSHTTTAFVELDSRVYCIPGKSLLKLMQAESAVGQALSQILSYRLYRAISDEYKYEFPASVYTVFYPDNSRRSSQLSAALASAMVAETQGPILLLSLSKASIFNEGHEPVIQNLFERWPNVSVGDILSQTQKPELNFDLLVGSEIHDAEFNAEAAARIIPAFLGRLKKYYASVIVDAGRHFENPVLTKVLTQSDRILLIRDPMQAPHASMRWKAVAEYCARQVKDFAERVVTLSDEQSSNPQKSTVYNEIDPFTAHPDHHFRIQSTAADIQQALKEKPFKTSISRLARSLSGTSRAICFGGGGARSFAHVGVIEVLEHEGIDFDAVAGTSMGAVIGCAYARGDSALQISTILKSLIPDSTSILDKRLPLISFYRGAKLEKVLSRAFGDLQFSELEIPFYCNGCDLESGRQLIFEQGFVATALRASVSLPGVFPPYQMGNYRIIDGGIINNLPGAILRNKQYKRIIGITVASLEDRSASQAGVKHRSGGWIAKLKDYFSVPPILKIINRAISIQGNELLKLHLQDFDFIFNAEVGEFDLFDFHRRDEIIESGRRAALQNLDQIKAQLKQPRHHRYNTK